MNLSDIIRCIPHDVFDQACVILSDGNESSPQKTLTWSQAQTAFLQHEEWLLSKLEQLPTRETYEIIVSYMSNNQSDLFLSVLACTGDAISKVALPALLNTRWTAQEVATVLESEQNDGNQITMLLYESSFKSKAEKVKQILRHNCLCLELPSFARTLFRSVDVKHINEKKASPRLFPEEVEDRVDSMSHSNRYSKAALIVYTSGTTSGSKGVLLSHGAIYVQALAKLQHPCGYSHHTRLLASTVPFFHVGGISSILAVWIAGGCLVLPTDTGAKGFDAGLVIKQLSSRTNLNSLVVVPAMLYSLQQEVTRIARTESKTSGTNVFSKVQLILVGGQSASPATLRFVSQTFPRARLVQTYACTEAASSLTFLEVLSPERNIRSQYRERSDFPSGDCVGLPPRHVKICLFDADPADGSNMRISQRPKAMGVIATRGPHIMNGYWKRGNSRVLLPTSVDHEGNKWLLTNDIGFFDENGQLYFCGRVSDSIRTGGETVLAGDVERTLLQHDLIDDCAVFGLKDDRFGEQVCCALVAREKMSLSDVRKWCEKQGLAGYKRPRKIFYVLELPRNSSGKVLKFRLRERFEEKAKLQSKL